MVKSAANGYLLQDEGLVRKWVSHRENVVVQVVVPLKFCDEVLKTSHHQSGHLWVHEVHFKYFFRPLATVTYLRKVEGQGNVQPVQAKNYRAVSCACS